MCKNKMVFSRSNFWYETVTFKFSKPPQLASKSNDTDSYDIRKAKSVFSNDTNGIEELNI